jgi:hypothetical protein
MTGGVAGLHADRAELIVMNDLDVVLFDYIAQANPESDDDLKRYLKRYPQYREEIIEFTASWRALSILDAMPPEHDPAADREILRRATAQARALMRRTAIRAV